MSAFLRNATHPSPSTPSPKPLGLRRRFRRGGFFKAVRAGLAVKRRYLNHKDTSVWTHGNFFQYLTTEKHFELEGCLGAQVGSDTIYKGLFREGAKRLEKADNDNDRSASINPLNYARTNSPKS